MTAADPHLEDYDFDLPPRCIAQEPPAQRRDARLLVWSANGGFEHRRVFEIPSLIRAGDALVINETKVFPARLLGVKLEGGARVELLLIRSLGGSGGELWEAMVRPGRRLAPGAEVVLEGGVQVEVGDRLGESRRQVRFGPTVDVLAHAWRHGHVPLPPYIRRPDTKIDRDRYQTVFARDVGSVAAPTAGLHLDPSILEEIQARGASILPLSLHVGPGTFRPVSAEDVRRGELHRERYSVPLSTVRALRHHRAERARVIAVGTTVCRTLETIDLERDEAQTGETTLFIRPGHSFGVTDVLLTNFHLPRSSLLMLVAALAGSRWKQAYRLAVREGYRFYSYGDANWIETERGTTR